eukprot:PhM_4_TR7122/c0_g2_i1/m.79055
MNNTTSTTTTTTTITTIPQTNISREITNSSCCSNNSSNRQTVFSRAWTHLWAVLYTNTIHTDDDLAQHLRKSTIAISMFFTVFLFMNILHKLYLGNQERWSASELVLYAGPSIFMLVCILFCWTYMKADKHVSDLNIHVFLIAVNVTLTVTQLATPQHSFLAVYCASACISVFAAMSRYVNIPVALLCIALDSYNHTLGSPLHGVLGTLRFSSSESTLSGSFMTLFVNLGAFAVLFRLTTKHITSHTNTNDTYDTSVSLVGTVTECLAEYRTTAAAKSINRALEQQEGDEAVMCVDPVLCRHLWRIVLVMERYKPHIPSYLLGDDDDDDDNNKNNNQQENPSSSHHIKYDGSSLATDDDDELVTVISRHSCATPFSNASEVDPGVVTDDVVPFDSPMPAGAYSKRDRGGSTAQHHAHVSVPGTPRAASASHPPSPLGGATRRKITLALVHAPVLRDDVVFDTAAAVIPEASLRSATSFIDRVHADAEATHGIIHQFWGDALVVSWNAARRVAQPEVGAAGLLLRCRDGIAGTTVFGAAYSGEAVFTLCGRRQVVPVLQCPWHHELRVLFYMYARRYGTSVCDEQTARRLVYAARCRGFAAVQLSSAHAPILVHEIVEERGSNINHNHQQHQQQQEWMYELAEEHALLPGGTEEKCVAMTTALRHAAVDGDVGEGIECLRRVGLWAEGSVGGDDRILDALRSALARASSSVTVSGSDTSSSGISRKNHHSLAVFDAVADPLLSPFK